MTVENNCIKLCEDIRRRGFEESGITAVIPDDAMKNATVRLKWSERTTDRYLGKDGYLVQFGYLKVVSGGYELTGEDLRHD